MRTAVLLTLFLSLGIAFAAWTESHNGRPACQNAIEMSQRLWRNNFDPTKYFICAVQNQPAEYASCEQEHLFDASQLRCVHMDSWTWVEPSDPPSLA